MSQPLADIAPNPSALPSILSQVAVLMGAGNYREAIAQLLPMTELVKREPLVCNTLGHLFLHVDSPRDAIPWFDQALSLQPDYLQAIMGLGTACQAVGDHEWALNCFNKAVSIRSGDAQSWYYRGCALADLGRIQEALSSLDRAIALNGVHILAQEKRSQIREASGFSPAAAAAAPAEGQLSPNEPLYWSRLGDRLHKAGDFAQAVAAYNKGLERSPQDYLCLYNRSHALEATGRRLDALASAQDALRVEPENREALMMCGTLELKLGNVEAAHACFLMIAEMGVVRNYPTAHKPAKFRALLLFSPESGNTPFEDLIRDGSFDTEIVMVLRGYRNNPDVRSPYVDVVVNLISEADFGLDVMAAAIDLADSLERPVVNHPRLMLATDRESISRRLALLPGAVMPATVRIDAVDLLRRARDRDPMSFPLIVRHLCTHGGDMMELVQDFDGLQRFAEAAGQRALYMTRFVDYKSADGLYRKYRFLFVGDQILPYHLAIGDGWKVHHASTRMGEVEWMRGEEDAFLNDPVSVFGKKGMAVLDAIRRQVGLDYCGIDCSLDSEGRVVVFEVNASMLVHVQNAGFEYKTPHVKKIKLAFEQLLERKANEYKASIEATGRRRA